MQNLGQHFLKNKSALQFIAGSLNPAATDTVIEIGPGHGELTEFLAATNAKKIIAIEKDEALYRALVKSYQDNDRVAFILGDALELLPDITRDRELKTGNYKIAGNIPYYITGHLFRVIGELESKPEQCLFTLQKEVAERLCAVPPRMNRLAASVQFWANAKMIKTLPASDFNPPPKVLSAIILLEGISPARSSAEKYYTAVRGIFAQPRKTLVNNIAAATGQKGDMVAQKLLTIGIQPTFRPQNLTIDNITAIASLFFAS